MLRKLSSQIIENPEIDQLKSQSTSDLYNTHNDVDRLANKSEKTALEKIINLCNALDIALASTQSAEQDEESRRYAEIELLAAKNSAAKKLEELTYYDFRYEGYKRERNISELCKKLEKLREEDAYLCILKKITNDEEAVSAEELLYFVSITDMPELINLYDLYNLKKCIDAESYKYRNFKLNFEILVGLRARRDRHFSIFNLEMLETSRAHHQLDQTTQPLFATRLCRKLDDVTASLRKETYYQFLSEKVKKDELLLDDEALYFGLVTDDYLLFLFHHPYPLNISTTCLEKIENNELREALKQKLNMLISLRGNHHYPHDEDPELIAKLYERSVLAQDWNRKERLLLLNLENMNLSGLNLIGSDLLTYVNAKGANFEYAKLDKAQDVNFSGAHMHGAEIYNRANDTHIYSMTWDACNFNGADLSEATMIKPHLRRCTFAGANFEKANVTLSSHPEYNDADFNGARFNSATIKNFNACKHGVKHVSVVGARLTNSKAIFKNPESIDELFSFTDVKSLNEELDYLEKIVLPSADNEKYLHHIYYFGAESLKDDIKLAAARHIIKRVNAIEDLSLHRDLMDAACAHSVFQPVGIAARTTNTAVTFATSKIHGWFSQGVDISRPWPSTPALDELIPARNQLRAGLPLNSFANNLQ